MDKSSAGGILILMAVAAYFGFLIGVGPSDKDEYGAPKAEAILESSRYEDLLKCANTLKSDRDDVAQAVHLVDGSDGFDVLVDTVYEVDDIVRGWPVACDMLK